MKFPPDIKKTFYNLKDDSNYTRLVSFFEDELEAIRTSLLKEGLSEEALRRLQGQGKMLKDIIDASNEARKEI